MEIKKRLRGTNRMIFSRPRSTLALFLGLLVLPLGYARAGESEMQVLQKMSFADLLAVTVVTPSKLPESMRRSPNIVSIFTAREIELFGGQDLGEVLSRITSFQPYNNIQTGRGRLSIRGDDATFNNNHVLILLNGTPMNRESYTGGIWTQTMLTAVPLSIIDRIELMRGPGSVLYGTNAFSGVVNIITKVPEGSSATLKAGYGGDQTHSIDANATMSLGDIKINSALSVRDTDGWKIKMWDSGGGRYRDRAGAKSIGTLTTAQWRNFSSSFYWGSSDQTTIRGTPDEYLPGYTDNQRFLATIRYRQPLGEDWEARVTASNAGGRTTTFWSHCP